MANDKKFFENMYQRAGSPEKLPWHSDQPPQFLDQAIKKNLYEKIKDRKLSETFTMPPAFALDKPTGPKP